jgi:hypothetical protein
MKGQPVEMAIATTRAQALAQQFEQANQEVITVVERCGVERWQAICAAEEWPVAVVAHHIASVTEVVTGWVQALAGGQGAPSVTMAEIDEMNRQHAEQYAGCTRAEALELLVHSGSAASAVVRALDDAALERSAPFPLFGGQVLSVEQLITLILISHPRGHLESIRATVEQ